jgi:subtilisin family serine protease
MTVARTATAAAVAGLVAVAAWSAAIGPSGPERVAVGSGIAAAASSGLEWQLGATGEDRVPSSVLAGASQIRIAIIDTGADVSAPSIASNHPLTHDTRTGISGVADPNGHGTFVASLAAGFGGNAQLLIVKAGGASGMVTATDEAAAIRYAVDHHAKIINLSIAGPSTSAIERRAIQYAVSRGTLLVAAVGNDYGRGNPVEYPAALLQPPGSNGRGGVGLAVAASTRDGTRAPFSNTGSWVSLAAPGAGVLGSVSALSSPLVWPRIALSTATSGLYGYASGSSFAAPEVAGAAALVWSANSKLTAAQVAELLKDTASSHGNWTADLGFGVLDVASAVELAQSMR